MSKTLKFTVKGIVQGVGYRYATQKAALKLNLVGWVRNCSNGDVEGVVSGEKSDVENFVYWLWKGSQYSKVNQVDTRIEKDTHFKTFQVIR